ncbi:unnamed protein product [Brachionus calyciflorus]|uniref:Uncharacterized protein n=1 Tax=Brachionus calyciflorus TaxID=104777 RepID=A0A813XDR1_9BILA|nr:unnamed protein product [Brachionus calyciflorus]
MESKRELIKVKLAKMRLRLKQKREKFLKMCSNTSRMVHMEYQQEIKKQNQELNDSVLSVEVVFDSGLMMSDNLTSTLSSRTSTPIQRKPLRKKKRTNKIREPSLKENNLYNYSASIFQSPALTSSFLNQDFGQLKVWYL